MQHEVFKGTFLEYELLYFDTNQISPSILRVRLTIGIVCLGNDMAPNIRKTISQSYGNPVTWYINTSSGINQTEKSNQYMLINSETTREMAKSLILLLYFTFFTRCMLLCSIINRGLFPHIKTLLMPDTEHSGFEGWYDAYQGISRATFHWRFFHRNSNSMKISFHSHLDSNTVIATKFCTWHDSCVLSWHVQKFVVIGWPATELWQGEVSIEFDLRAKKR